MQQNKVFLTNSKNGVEVWYDSIASHAATHIRDTPNLDALAAEVLTQTVITDSYVQLHLDLGRVVGLCDLVENEPGDEVIYAKRINRDSYSVFNRSKPPQPSSLVTIAVELQDDLTYELVSAWIGPSDLPSFPGTERETPASKPFWQKHSFAWGNQQVLPESITSLCPW